MANMRPTPQVLARKANGVSSHAASPTSCETPKSNKVKAPAVGEKVVIRRLAPGMTEAEFLSIIGGAWAVGKGKVDWFDYFPGNMSKDPAKPSRPSRAYIHVMRREDLVALQETMRNAAWEDAKASFSDSCLVGPPELEVSIYKKVSLGKKRTDTRQGTIDTDPDFKAFLESLTNPEAAKEAEAPAAQSTDDDGKPERVTTTPLVEYIKEKKAQRMKDAAAAKFAKQHARSEPSVAKGKAAAATTPATPVASAASTTETPKKRSRGEKRDKSSDKAEKQTDEPADRSKETVKILNKKAATEQVTEAAKAVARNIHQATAQTSTAPSPQDLQKNRRAGIAAAARLLQRDLGLSSGSAHRKARLDAAKAESQAKAGTGGTESKEKDACSAPKQTPPSAPGRSNPEPPTGPAAAKTAEQLAAISGSSRSRKRRGGGGGGVGISAVDEAGGNTKTDKTSEAVTAAPAIPPVKAPVILNKDATPASAVVKDILVSVPTGPAAQKAAAQRAAAQKAAHLASNSPASARPIPTGPSAATLGKHGSQRKANNNVAQQPSAGATRAFVKHVNPSQGVTEMNLKEAMQAFGPVTFVEIDRRKGYAHVDFATPEGLAKAMAASPVSVASATVQVLERKDTTSSGKRALAMSASAGAKPAAALVSGEGAAANSTSKVQPPTGPAADNRGFAYVGQERERRAGRRRGGRGRGDKDASSPKDKAGASTGGGKKTDGGSTSGVTVAEAPPGAPTGPAAG